MALTVFEAPALAEASRELLFTDKVKTRDVALRERAMPEVRA